MNGAEVTFVGNLTKTVELKYSSGGAAWASLSIAVNERSRSRDGEMKESVVFFNCKVFGEMAENLAASADKGDRVMVNGRIRTDSWTNADGQEQKREVLYIDEVAASMRWATATVKRNPRTGSQNGNYPPQAAAAPAAQAEDNPFV